MTIEAVSATPRTNLIQNALGRQPQNPSGNPVQDAADEIENLLDSSGWNQWVDANEVVRANDILVGLDPTTADAVVDELDRRGLLDKFMSEMVDSSNVGGGVSADNRRTILSNFAKMLDGDSLVKVERALFNAREGTDKVQWINELSQAIATHSSNQAKLDFVEGMGQYTTDNSDHWSRDTYFGGSSYRVFEGDVDALAVANVLGSMENAGTYRDQALASLTDSQFKAVVNASIQSESNTTSGMGSSHTSLTYDTTAFTALANTVAASDNVSRKAEFMEYGGIALQAVRDGGSLIGGVSSLDKDETVAAMLDGMTAVMDSDTSGIVQELATQADNKFGNGLASYAKSMLESGEAGREKLAEQLNAIKYGNDGTGNVHDRLAQENQYGDRPVAAALGYFSGAVWAGAESISNDKQAQADLITDVLVTAVSLHPATAVSAEGIKHLVNAAVQNDANLGEAMYQSVLPTDANGTISVNADIQDTIHTRFSDVAEHANP